MLYDERKDKISVSFSSGGRIMAEAEVELGLDRS